MSRRAGPAERPWIDTAEFARSGSRLSAVQPAGGFARLRALLAGDGGEIAWTLAGERRPRPEGGADLFMCLRLRGSLQVPCIRCLQPVPVTLDEQRLFKLALTEAQAEREDRDAEDYDVLATSVRFDVLDLVEDEAIMALPIAPRHEDCRLPAAAGGAARGAARAAGTADAEPRSETPASPERANPFKILERLKRSRGTDGSGGEEA